MMRLPLIWFASVALGSAATAQTQPPNNPGVTPGTMQPRLRGVEQRVEDLSPISVSLRSLQADLRQPSGFESVYRVPGEGNGGDRLMRVDGALTATFTQSVYAPLYVRERFMLFFSRERKIGYVPQVPPGTVFRIGSSPLESKPKDGPRLSQPQWAVSQEPAAQRAATHAIAATLVVEAPVSHGATRRAAQPEDAKPQAKDAKRASRTANATMTEEPPVDEAEQPAPVQEDRVRNLLRRAVERERAGSRG